MVYMFSASYILYYYQDILGVSAIAMGMILMAARVFDAFNDRLWGLLWQRQGHGSGSFVRGCLWERAQCIVLYLMFAAPLHWTGGGW